MWVAQVDWVQLGDNIIELGECLCGTFVGELTTIHVVSYAVTTSIAGCCGVWNV